MKTPVFKGSFTGVEQIPKMTLPEFAFCGRSNVGKSSLINYLANVRNLARVSQTPGKTQLINYFEVDDQWHLVDLPGFGFAKVPKTMRFSFQKMIQDYLSKSEMLQCVFLLIDSRIPTQKSDLEFANRLGEWEIPFALVFTKADKHTSAQIKANIESFKNKMMESWEELPPVFITSAKNKKGREDILEFITKTVQQGDEK